MRFVRSISILGFAISLSGCLSMVEPMITYKDTNHPKSDTSVFAVDFHQDNEDGTAYGFVLAVDGHSTRDWTSVTEQNPPWVRVLPGTHQFKITYRKTNSQFMVDTVSVPDMLPRHVYVAHLVDLGMSYKIKLEDAGDGSSYKEKVPNRQTMKHEDVSATF